MTTIYLCAIHAGARDAGERVARAPRKGFIWACALSRFVVPIAFALHSRLFPVALCSSFFQTTMHLLTGLSIAALPALALGHNGAHVHRHLQARQSSAAASTTVVSTSSASSAAASGATTAAASASSLAAPSVSLLSSNPTAVPLTQIVATESSDTSGHASTTYAAGATPSAVSGAPGLPDSECCLSRPTRLSILRGYFCPPRAHGIFLCFFDIFPLTP